MANSTSRAGRGDQRKAAAERRSGADRRKVDVGPPTPPGIERRTQQRRSGRDRRRDG